MSVETEDSATPMPYDSVAFERVYVLPKNVSAIQILPSEEGQTTRLGLISQLPEGAEIRMSGPGFNDGTLRVRCGSASYYVFLDDLDLVRKQATAAGV